MPDFRKGTESSLFYSAQERSSESGRGRDSGRREEGILLSLTGHGQREKGFLLLLLLSPWFACPNGIASGEVKVRRRKRKMGGRNTEWHFITIPPFLPARECGEKIGKPSVQILFSSFHFPLSQGQRRRGNIAAKFSLSTFPAPSIFPKCCSFESPRCSFEHWSPHRKFPTLAGPSQNNNNAPLRRQALEVP